MRGKRLFVAGAAAVALLFGVYLSFASGPTASAAGWAYVRVVHAAPAAPDVDVYVDNSSTPLLSNFKFGTVTNYVQLAAGSHTISVTPAGQPVSKAVITQSVTVDAGTNYTLGAVGDTYTTPALVAFVDNNSVVSGKAKVRVYHLSGDAGPVSISTGGKTLISSLDFKQASNYLSVPPGSYNFDVTLHKTGKTVPLSATLEANKVTSVFGLGLVNGSNQTAFTFATAVVAGTPTGMPQTGFAPREGSTVFSVNPLLALGLLVVLIGCGYGVRETVRRVR